MSITLAIRQLLASLSKNPKLVKYGAVGAGGALGGWTLKGVYEELSKPFTIKTGENERINLFPLLLIGLIIYILYKKKVI